jgi:hypothetical protein
VGVSRPWTVQPASPAERSPFGGPCDSVSGADGSSPPGTAAAVTASAIASGGTGDLLG